MIHPNMLMNITRDREKERKRRYLFDVHAVDSYLLNWKKSKQKKFFSLIKTKRKEPAYENQFQLNSIYWTKSNGIFKVVPIAINCVLYVAGINWWYFSVGERAFWRCLWKWPETKRIYSLCPFVFYIWSCFIDDETNHSKIFITHVCHRKELELIEDLWKFSWDKNVRKSKSTWSKSINGAQYRQYNW